MNILKGRDGEYSDDGWNISSYMTRLVCHQYYIRRFTDLQGGGEQT